MNVFGDAFSLAISLIVSGNSEFWGIVGRSLFVNGTATLCATFVALPLAAILAMVRFPGHGLVIALIQAFMALPSVFVGLMVYMLLSRQGPLGVLDLLYSPGAMIMAQVILVTPLILANAQQSLVMTIQRHDEMFSVWGLNLGQRIVTLLLEARWALVTAVLAGFGRALAEVGAIMIVGGNIRHATRTMTTAIALETSRGELALALALGLILVGLSIAVAMMVFALRTVSRVAL